MMDAHRPFFRLEDTVEAVTITNDRGQVVITTPEVAALLEATLRDFRERRRPAA